MSSTTAPTKKPTPRSVFVEPIRPANPRPGPVTLPTGRLPRGVSAVVEMRGFRAARMEIPTSRARGYITCRRGQNVSNRVNDPRAVEVTVGSLPQIKHGFDVALHDNSAALVVHNQYDDAGNEFSADFDFNYRGDVYWAGPPATAAHGPRPLLRAAYDPTYRTLRLSYQAFARPDSITTEEYGPVTITAAIRCPA